MEYFATHINCFLGFFLGDASGRPFGVETFNGELLISNGIVVSAAIAVIWTVDDAFTVDVFSIPEVGSTELFGPDEVILWIEWLIIFGGSDSFSLLENVFIKLLLTFQF